MDIRWIAIAGLLCACGAEESGAVFDDHLPGGSGGSGGALAASAGGAGGSAGVTAETQSSSSASVSGSMSTSVATTGEAPASGSSSTASVTGSNSVATTVAVASSAASTTGSADPVPGCNATLIEGQCENGADRGSYSCPDGGSGYYATDGRQWPIAPGSESSEILCVLLDHTLECLGIGDGCHDSSSSATTVTASTGNTGGDMTPSVPGCVAGKCAPGDFTKGSYCYWHPVDFPDGECFDCEAGWSDCDGQEPEFDGWQGGEMGCETRDSELNDTGQCGDCGPNTPECECDVDGNCSGGW